MHLQPVFQGCRVIGGSVADHLFERGLCLPSGTQMTDADVTRVIGGLLATPRRAAGLGRAGRGRPGTGPSLDSVRGRNRRGSSSSNASARGPADRRSCAAARDAATPSRSTCCDGLRFALAYLLRFEFSVPWNLQLDAITQLPLVLATQLTALYMSGVLSFVWKYVGIADVPAFARAAAGSTAFLVALRLFLTQSLTELRIPMSVILVDAVLAFGGLLGARVLRRALWEREVSRKAAVERGARRRLPVLLVGAGAAGVLAVREIRSRGAHDMEMCGFVDDDPLKQGAIISGIKVLGTTEDLPRLVPALGIGQVIVTVSHASEEQIRGIVSICEGSPCGCRWSRAS
jgi:hypothetical protein